MPELPEVETIKLGLQSKIVGKKNTDIEILVSKIFQGDKKEVIGKCVVGIWRRAKILGIDLDNNFTLLIHLKLTGQLVYAKDGASHTFGHPIPFAGTNLPAKSTAVIFGFSDGSKLFYNDVRKFGWIKVINHQSAIINQLFSEFGIEPFTPEFTKKAFEELLKKYKRPIKLILMDQKIIAGVGNIYANEALFLAKIDPRRQGSDLKISEVGKLYKSLLNVLKMGIKYHGSSESAYVDIEGEKGSMQEHFKVYGKKDEECSNKCGGKIKRIVLGGRGTFYCSHCQH